MAAALCSRCSRSAAASCITEFALWRNAASSRDAPATTCSSARKSGAGASSGNSSQFAGERFGAIDGRREHDLLRQRLERHRQRQAGGQLETRQDACGGLSEPFRLRRIESRLHLALQHVGGKDVVDRRRSAGRGQGIAHAIAEARAGIRERGLERVHRGLELAHVVAPCGIVVAARRDRCRHRRVRRRRLGQRGQPGEPRRKPRRVASHGSDTLQPSRTLPLSRLHERALAIAQLRQDVAVLALHRARFLQRTGGEHQDALREEVTAGDGAAHGRSIMLP
jgi:hypothetical protein